MSNVVLGVEASSLSRHQHLFTNLVRCSFILTLCLLNILFIGYPPCKYKPSPQTLSSSCHVYPVCPVNTSLLLKHSFSSVNIVIVPIATFVVRLLHHKMSLGTLAHPRHAMNIGWSSVHLTELSPHCSQLTSPDVPLTPQPLLRQEVAANVVEGHFAGSQMFPFFSPFFVHQHPASSISPRAVVVVSGSAPRPHVNNALNGSYDQFSLARAELSPHITGCFKVACINTWTSTWPERLESHIVDSRPSWRQTMQFAALCRPPLPPSAAPSSSQSVTCLWPH